jgi:hypothetical protein
VSARPETMPAPPVRAVGALRSTIALRLEKDGTLVIVLSAFAIVMLIALRHGLVVDGWMALVSGREVAQHGLPAHDALTVWAHGRRWTDQQWLAQLGLYELVRLGGIKLALFFHALLGVGAVVGAAALARRLGASARSAAWICLPVFVAFYPEAAVLRPQSFGYPMFVAVLWLLALDARSPSRRVFLVCPLLALWANLHGSALLGAALVSLAGVSQLADGLLARPRHVSARALALVIAPPLCLLASPYGLQLPAYYQQVLHGGDFSRFVSEWAPTTLTPATAPVYGLVIFGMWLLGRSGARVSTFEKLAFIATAALAFEAVRNTAWFGLVALVVLPRLLDDLRRAPAVEPRRLNRVLGAAIPAFVLLTAFGVAAKPDGWFTAGFPSAAADAAAHGRVFAMSPYADWLLWTHPELRGRVVFDARFELFSSADVGRLGAFEAQLDGWQQTLAGYTTVVLDARKNQGQRDALVNAKQAQVVYSDSDIIVLRLRA